MRQMYLWAIICFVDKYPIDLKVSLQNLYPPLAFCPSLRRQQVVVKSVVGASLPQVLV
jgi:hypothetical protein